MSIAERKERERLYRQNLIIDAAQKVFMNKGFETATMDDIAEEAEFSKGSLYSYFQSKNELCLSIVLRGLKIVVSDFEKVVSQTTTSIKKIGIIATTYLKFYKKYPNYIFAFSNYKQHRTGCKFDSSILKEIEAENLLISKIIEQTIENGKIDKSINLNADANKLALILWGNLSGLIPVLLQDSDETNSVELFNYTFQLICDAIKS